MHDQLFGAIGFSDQKLGATGQALNPCTRQACRHVLWKRKAEIRAVQLDRTQYPAFQIRLEATADSFDFR